MEQHKVLNNLFLVNSFLYLFFSDVNFVFPSKEKFMNTLISLNLPYGF